MGLPVIPSLEGIQEMDYFAWAYTTFLNLIILPLGAWLGWVGAKKGGDHHGMARS